MGGRYLQSTPCVRMVSANRTDRPPLDHVRNRVAGASDGRGRPKEPGLVPQGSQDGTKDPLLLRPGTTYGPPNRRTVRP